MQVVDIFEFGEGKHYFRNHVWADPAGDGVLFGIDDFAQKLLGLVDSIRLPPVGDHIGPGAPLAVVNFRRKICEGSLCTYSSNSDVFASPIAGVVIEVNNQLRDRPALVQEDSYGRGWLLRLIPDSALDGQLEGLVPEDELEQWIEAEIERRSDDVAAIRSDWL